MSKVTYMERGLITDVMVDGKYVGAVIKTEAGYVTSHKSDSAVSGTFAQKHFACYHVEKSI